MTNRHGKFVALLVVLLGGFATMPLFQPYFFASSDGLFHLYRLMEYHVVLRDRVPYPRWAPDFFYGLGMPLFNFYAPLTYYLGEVFHLLGFGYIDSFKLLVAATMVGAGLGAYLYARLLLAPLSSLLVAVVYMYAPYHLVNLYYRADLAEYIASTWFPFLLWAMTRLIRHRRFRDLFAGSVFYAALILTHNLSAFIFSAFLVVYALAALWREHSLPSQRWSAAAADALRLGGLAVGGWALTVFFWLPALAEKSLVDFDRLLLHYDFHEHFPTVEELLSTDLFHRYGVVFRSAEVYGYKLGLLQAIFLVLGLAVLLWQRNRLARAIRLEAGASLLVAALSLILIFPISLWAWENMPLLNLTQFPWRLLAFLALPSALFAGLLAEALPGRARSTFVALLVPLVIASSVARMVPIFSNLQEADVSPRGSLAFELSYGAVGTAAAAEYLPRWVKERPATSPLALSAILGEPIGPVAGRTAPGMEAVPLDRKATRISYRVRAEKTGDFVPNILFFPGWLAELDGRPVDTTIDDPSGLIKIAVPQGEHTITFRFVETPLRQAADAVSVLAGLALLAGLGWDLRRRHPGASGQWAVSSEQRRDFVVVASAARAAREALKRPLRTETAVKLGLVAVVALVWLGGKAAYDAAYVPAAAHRFPLVVNLDDQVLIEGYDLSGVAATTGTAVVVQPGASFAMTVFWRPSGSDAAGYRPYLRLTNSFRQTWAYAEAPAPLPEAGARGEGPIATTMRLVVPPGTPPGVYEIEVGFISAASGRLLEVRRVRVSPMLPGERGTRVGPVFVGRNPVAATLASLGANPGVAEPVNFGDSLRLLDLTIEDGEALRSGRPGAPLPRAAGGEIRQARAGDAIHLSLLWQALAKRGEDLTVTARLVGADGTLWTVRDSQPADGAYPTPLWSPDEIVRDQLNLVIPPETPPAEYELQLEVVARGGPLSIFDRHHVPIGPTLRLGAISVLPAAQRPDPDKTKIQRRLEAPLAEGLGLLGYGLGRRELQPGERLKVDLLWYASKAPTRDLTMRLEIADRQGQVWASDVRRPVGDAYPTAAWREGDLLRGQYNLTLGAGATAGEAVVSVSLVDGTGGTVLARQDLDRVQVLPRTRSFTANPTRPLEKVFDGKIRLLGFDLAGGPTESGQWAVGSGQWAGAAGETLLVTMHWQAMAQMGTSYTVFAQVLNAEGRLVAQHDALPRGGKAPTTAWVENEVTADEHAIPLPADLPAGEYTVIAGLYDGLGGKRLPVWGGNDFVSLTQLRLAAPSRR